MKLYLPTKLMDMNLDKLQEMVRDREAWFAGVHGITQSQIRLGDWTSTAANQVSILEMESSQHTPEFQNDYSSYILPV